MLTNTNNSKIEYGALKPKGYRPRIADALIQQALRTFGGVEIRGPKWCGKTWSALAAGESITSVDTPDIRDLISADPLLALEGDRPHVIDEWQEVPAIWDAVRHEIDAQGNQHGMFLLTGSSTPKKDKVIHSGAGRIARIDLKTLTMHELGLSSAEVSLAKLFRHEPIQYKTEQLGLKFFANRICSGGWPALIQNDYEDAALVIEQYLEALFEVSIPSKDGNPHLARRIAKSLARNNTTAAKLSTIAADSDLENKPSVLSDLSGYIELFKDFYVLEELPGWDAPVRSKSRVRAKPKRYLADTSLACSLLGINPQRLLTDSQLMGMMFESLCIHDLGVYASILPEASRNCLYYYQDADGLEVDAIIELNDGSWGAIELKLGEDKVDDGIKNLNRLRKKVAKNPAARNPEPSFMAVITANSPFARYDKENDVFVFPLSALCP